MKVFFSFSGKSLEDSDFIIKKCQKWGCWLIVSVISVGGSLRKFEVLARVSSPPDFP